MLNTKLEFQEESQNFKRILLAIVISFIIATVITVMWQKKMKDEVKLSFKELQFEYAQVLNRTQVQNLNCASWADIIKRAQLSEKLVEFDPRYSSRVAEDQSLVAMYHTTDCPRPDDPI